MIQVKVESFSYSSHREKVGTTVGSKMKWHKIYRSKESKDGTSWLWRDNGILYAIESYKKGVLHGPCKMWDENGGLIYQESYHYGESHGKFMYFHLGSLSKIIYYDKGRITLKVLHEQNGEYREINYVNHYKGDMQVIKRFSKDGELLKESTIQEESKNSGASSYHFNDRYYNDQLDMYQQGPEFWDNL
jgi:antitoxin component YwqK of YwqJK toxin-antitoxin module